MCYWCYLTCCLTQTTKKTFGTLNKTKHTHHRMQEDVRKDAHAGGFHTHSFNTNIISKKREILQTDTSDTTENKRDGSGGNQQQQKILNSELVVIK